MDKDTLEALKGSIKKWEGIVEGTTRDEGTANCPLCQKFNTNEMKLTEKCRGCPVMIETRQIGCAGTPYIEYEDAVDEFGEDSVEAEGIAKEELCFLQSLLPEGEES